MCNILLFFNRLIIINTNNIKIFDQDKISNKLSAGHFGLSGLKLRAERMLGTLDIDSEIGSGTKMYGSIPISSKDITDIEIVTLEFGI